MKAQIKVSNMHCEGCKKRIAKRLSNLKDVKNVNIDLDKKIVSLEYNNISLEEIIEYINEIGFEASK